MGAGSLKTLLDDLDDLEMAAVLQVLQRPICRLQEDVKKSRICRALLMAATGGSSPSGIPANAMLFEDGTPMLTEDGKFMLYE